MAKKPQFSPPQVTVEPSEASIPAGESFSFRIASPDREALKPFKLQWTRNGVRIPGATGVELNFLQMKEKHDGEYKALILDGNGIYSSNCVTLKTAPAGSRAFMRQKERTAQTDSFFFDPLAEEEAPAPVVNLTLARKKAFLEKALSRCVSAKPSKRAA